MSLIKEEGENNWQSWLPGHSAESPEYHVGIVGTLNSSKLETVDYFEAKGDTILGI